MTIVALWMGMIIIGLLQVPMIVREKMWKELLVFAVLWLIAGVYSTLIIVFPRMINIYKLIAIIIDRLFQILEIGGF